MKNVLGSLALLALVGAACNSGSDTLPTGQKFVLVDDQSGELAQDSQLVVFHISAFEGDSLLQSSRQGEGDPEKAILYPVDTAAGPENFFMAALRRMSAGDSATIVERVLRDRANPMSDSMDVTYGIRVLEIQDAAAGKAFREEMMAEQQRQQAEQESMIAAYRAREATVTDSLKAEINSFKSRGAKAAGYTTTASGLSYKILKPGQGAQPQPGDVVYVSYLGELMDGTVFDNSFGRAQPIDFPIGAGRVIPGWDEGVSMLSPGAQAVLMIPADLAYGPKADGPIPANAPLAFYVELLGVVPGQAPGQAPGSSPQ